ncbi:hypothetical protein QBC44DRAFT_305401 [Cladorrhinum sp. PSN332]|nr:hypothetical protein QBC44DRAFT_305401 [Cladorrhinum sp. PSN332]
MPSVAQETTPPSQSCKKRRRDDDDDNSHHLTLYAGLLANSTFAPTNHPVYSSHTTTTTASTTTTTTTPRSIFNEIAFESSHDHPNLLHHQHASLFAARKPMPLQFSKKQRTSVERDVETGMDGEAMQRSPSTSPSQRSRSLAHQSPTKHRPASPNRSIDPPTTAAVMSRCHICFRKPTKKSDLDSFADCQGCAQRTCYVCIRECLGWGPTGLQQPQIMSMQTESSFTMLDADQVAEDVDFGFGKQQDSSSSEGKGKGKGKGKGGGGGGEGGGDGGGAGWARGGGHRQMVCSRCCIEKGADGDVVCLGCLRFVEG